MAPLQLWNIAGKSGGVDGVKGPAGIINESSDVIPKRPELAITIRIHVVRLDGSCAAGEVGAADGEDYGTLMAAAWFEEFAVEAAGEPHGLGGRRDWGCDLRGRAHLLRIGYGNGESVGDF